MLVLTRKQNEKICIGDDVTITVVRTKGKTVRLGIQAPASKRVLRGEIAFDPDAVSADPAERRSGPRAVAKSATSESTAAGHDAPAPAGGRDDGWSPDASVRCERREPSDRRAGAKSNDLARPLHGMVRDRAV